MRPLAGCRVLDLGIITAGAATSALLADLSAEVIKVESPSFRDPFRIWSSAPPPGAGGGLPPFFRMTNRNKLSLSLDLKQPAGRPRSGGWWRKAMSWWRISAAACWRGWASTTRHCGPPDRT